MVVVGRDEGIVMNTANMGLQLTSNLMEKVYLTKSPENTEPELLTMKRKISPISFKIQNVTVAPRDTVDYIYIR